MGKEKREPRAWETIIIAVSPEQKAELERRAKAEVTSMSDLVRRAITMAYMPQPKDGVHDPRD